jgi:formylglycine-generating enzyme required for sulfatase activity
LRCCRARTEIRFSFGDDASKLVEHAWIGGNEQAKVGERFAHRVGQKKPNPWGLYDMHGSVFEWCRDYDAEALPGGRDPEIVENGSSRVMRGGCWAPVDLYTNT